MRVLLVALDVYSRGGGIGRYVQRVVRSLDELSVDTIVLSLWDRPVDAARAPESVRFVGCGSRKGRMATALLRELRREPVDVLLYGHVLLAHLARLARGRSAPRRSYLLAYGIEAWRPPSPPLARAVRRHVDGVVAISRTTMSRASVALGVPPESFRLLPPAIDPPEAREGWRPPPESAGVWAPRGPEETHRILAVSRLARADRYKGIDTLIRAMPAVRAALPGARLVVAGDGDWRPDLERLATAVGARDAVRFLGWVPDEGLAALYSNSDCLALPSSGEGFGIVYLEAWRAGLPVVAARAGAAAEVVEGEAGVLVEPGDVLGLSEALRSLLDDPGRRRRMGKAGRRLVEERYSHERFRAALADLLSREEHRCAASPAF